MLAIALGWKLAGVSVLLLFATAFVGAVTYETSSPRVRVVRRAAGAVAVAALLALVIIAIVGPGAWCEGGDAYRVPGCA
jgi:hypothetical protein